jgi:ADP-heptose:LPS heptosyltransferase
MALGTFFGVVEALDALVVGDSGPLHVANALRKPTVALFGPVHPLVRVKGCPHCRPLTANEQIKCGPCNDQQLQRCNPPAPCMEAIPDELIVAEVLEALDVPTHNLRG